MRHGGPHVLPLQQQGKVEKIEDMVYNNFAVSPQKRDLGKTKGGQ